MGAGMAADHVQRLPFALTTRDRVVGVFHITAILRVLRLAWNSKAARRGAQRDRGGSRRRKEQSAAQEFHHLRRLRFEGMNSAVPIIAKRTQLCGMKRQTYRGKFTSYIEHNPVARASAFTPARAMLCRLLQELLACAVSGQSLPLAKPASTAAIRSRGSKWVPGRGFGEFQIADIETETRANPGPDRDHINAIVDEGGHA